MRATTLLSVVVLAGLTGAILFADPVRTSETVALAVLMSLIADEDRKRFRVPDWANGTAALVGLIVVIEASITEGQSVPTAMLAALISAIACGASLLAIREYFFHVKGVDGLGLGDVKLGATAGIWLGWEMFCYAIMLAAIACLGVVAMSLVRRRGWPRHRRIPFALALAPSIWLCWILSQTARSSRPDIWPSIPITKVVDWVA
ncbi:A24 family peptidase [Aurantimonas sp. HBX-1]|uniref:prepilin peptidase n=1 Tax=Aurantimonas sp. HBX-1 TaxID=2906072 RepID=UPI001F484B26|nr:A24 family peptidase [Aurantimonas sp. HBX-1]UIJ73889.1 A24 family peptidase [Aurantimonas sp. HBX-1]